MVLCTVSILFRHVMRIGIRTSFSKPVHGTAHARRPSVEDMGIDHRGLYILVTEKFLDGPNVVTAFEQVRGEGVPECVTCGVLRQSRPGDSLPHRLLNK